MVLVRCSLLMLALMGWFSLIARNACDVFSTDSIQVTGLRADETDFRWRTSRPRDDRESSPPEALRSESRREANSVSDELTARHRRPADLTVESVPKPAVTDSGERQQTADSQAVRPVELKTRTPGDNRGNRQQLPSDSTEGVVHISATRKTQTPWQSAQQIHVKSQGCVTCHQGAHDPHFSDVVRLGCTDCHGGDATTTDKTRAHIHPRNREVFVNSGNPVRSYTALNHEDPAFIRFMNPGDLRIAHLSCGTTGCHDQEHQQVRNSMMTHGCMLWGAALYNNGSVSQKWSRYGESYSMHGEPQRLLTIPAPTAEDTERRGILASLEPLPRFEVTEPGNLLRVFERGGRFSSEIGIPERFEESGRPRTRASQRGPGTGTRTDPVFLGLQKTRLLDPTLNFLGTSDHPGDYRSSGCTACHMIYANDRSPIHSGPYSRYGNRGTAASIPDALTGPPDPMIPRNEPGHPITHRFTSAIPTSQCIVCHMHPGTSVMNSYLGYMWWDLETDARFMYPGRERRLSTTELNAASESDPNESAARGRWSDPDFLQRSSELNAQLPTTQFADFHGHGWVYQAVFRRDREGQIVDYSGRPILQPTVEQRQQAMQIPIVAREMQRDRDWTEPGRDLLQRVQSQEAELLAKKDNVPVHMLDIHLEKGMHCVDCHFVQDVHGNGKLYGEVRAAIEIQCIDCHGTADKPAGQVVDGHRQLTTSGPAAATSDQATVGRNLSAMRTPFGQRRFENISGRVIQNSMVEPNLSWEVPQVADTLDPDHPDYNPAAALAKTVRMKADGRFEWGDLPSDQSPCAHQPRTMSCIACHTSWNPSCFGCHLPQKANRRTPSLHNEGHISRNHIAYNFQTLRDDVFMLARDGNVTGNRIGPARSSCAVHVTSFNSNREAVYLQQQTVSAEGLSGTAFSTNVPHTVRGKGETKTCTDCHLAADNDNNALMAQLLMHGTNYFNFVGANCWVAAGKDGLHAIAVTERDEPQSVIGSTMHQTVYPDRYRAHVERGRTLLDAVRHPGSDIGEQWLRPDRQHEVLSVQVRGEYCYAACGEAGIRIYDTAFVEHKGFSQRITTAPVSPLGQRLYVESPYATDIAAPATMAVDPQRTRLSENHEQAVHPVYGYLYATDFQEGLILIGAGTLLDGNPLNNVLKKDLVFNPNGLLHGARSVTLSGTTAWVCCLAGLVSISLDDPLNPVVNCVLGQDLLRHPVAVEIQFRYAFVVDEEGLKVLDITEPKTPVLKSLVPLNDARNVYVARTYAYVSGGQQGLILVDVRDPLNPRVDQIYDAAGRINDLRDVKLGITYSSLFAYLADGRNGVHVVQLTSPETPGNAGFSPRPQPTLIATFPVTGKGRALCISEGLDRDRAVDEAGNQISVFGRVGARPLNLAEQKKLYYRNDVGPWFVTDPLRDWSMRDPSDRERRLRRQLEDFYGPSRR